MSSKEESNELAVAAQNVGLEPSKVEVLLSSFGEDWGKARDIVAQAQQISVTSEEQTQEMQLAREKRLELKKIRVSVEKTRVSLKEQSIREGKAIDGMANIIKAVIVPIEEKLERDEKFAEVKLAERRASLRAERIEKLSKYVDDVSIYKLDEMSDETFNNLLDLNQQSYQTKLQAEKEAEEKRKAEAEAEAKRQAEVREENERLKAEAEKQAKEQRKKDEAAAKERAKVEAEIMKEREAAAEKLRLETEARLKLEREAEDRRKAEEVKAQEEAKRKHAELTAPDKDKLMAYADAIDLITTPAVTSDAAIDVIKQTRELLARVTNNVRNRAREL